jgi:hypothetical protein
VGADDGGQLGLGVAGGDVLDLDGADPLAAGLDDVLGAVGDLHEAVASMVATSPVSKKPSVVEDLAAASPLKYSPGDHERALDQQLAEGVAVVRQAVAGVVGQIAARYPAAVGPA